MTAQNLPFYYSAPAANGRSWLEVMDRAGELSEVIANTEFVPRGLRGNQPAILAAILYGHEVGIGPMQSLAKIAVIDGRPTLAAEAQRALILAAGHELWIEESTNSRATVAGRRRGDKQTSRVTWTLDDAKRARIAGKPNWQAYPRQMLLARASAELAKAIFADVIAGLAATEELDGDSDGDAPRAELETETEAKPTTRRRRRTTTAEAEPAGEPPTPAAPPDMANRGQLNLLFVLYGERGLGAEEQREQRLAHASKVIGRPIASSNELTALEATRLIEALQNEPAEPSAFTPPADVQAALEANETEVQQALEDVGAVPYNEFPEGF
jgi:hypothetical protein